MAVTLTTVGFGDVLPQGPRNTFERGMYVIGIVGWLFLGLTFATVVLTKVTKFYEKADHVIATRMASGLTRRRRFHPCGCLKGEGCTAKVEVGVNAEQAECDTLHETMELGVDAMRVNDVEDDMVNKNLDPVTSF